MDVKIINIRVGKMGTTGTVVNVNTGEILMIAEIKTLVNFCKHHDYCIVNTKEMIDSIGEVLAKTMMNWSRFRNKLNS